MFEIKRKFRRSTLTFDPAPSRLVYLFNRLWLRKSFRFFLFVILPSLLIFVCTFFANKKYHFNILITRNVDKFFDFVAYSPAFRIVNLSVVSDHPGVVEKIKNNLSLKFPLSSLDLNVEDLKTQVEKIDIVRSAKVRLTSNGLIEVAVEVRKPVALQRIGKKIFLVDRNGAKVDEIVSRSERLDLPLLVGKGADEKVEEGLLLLLETKSLIARVRGLVRIGERRWDIILDRNQIIKLPQESPLRAMKKIISLHEGRNLFDRGIIYLDFRDIKRPVLGLTDDASKELKDIRKLVRGENV